VKTGRGVNPVVLEMALAGVVSVEIVVVVAVSAVVAVAFARTEGCVFASRRDHVGVTSVGECNRSICQGQQYTLVLLGYISIVANNV
jgi:hypothetical protein